MSIKVEVVVKERGFTGFDRSTVSVHALIEALFGEPDILNTTRASDEIYYRGRLTGKRTWIRKGKRITGHITGENTVRNKRSAS